MIAGYGGLAMIGGLGPLSGSTSASEPATISQPDPSVRELGSAIGAHISGKRAMADDQRRADADSAHLPVW